MNFQREDLSLFSAVLSLRTQKFRAALPVTPKWATFHSLFYLKKKTDFDPETGYEFYFKYRCWKKSKEWMIPDALHRRQNMRKVYEKMTVTRSVSRQMPWNAMPLSKMKNICKRKLKCFAWGRQNIIFVYYRGLVNRTTNHRDPVKEWKS
jgi:hypothetical protein